MPGGKQVFESGLLTRYCSNMKPGCRYCWSPFDKVCTDAHLHGCRDDTIRLCWICNRAYDHDLFTTRELIDAANVFEKSRYLQCRMNELAAEWRDGLAAGVLRWNTKMHRDKKYRIKVALDREEIAPIPAAIASYRSILRPTSSPNLAGRVAALKATKTRLMKKRSGPAGHAIQLQIAQLDRRIAGLKREQAAEQAGPRIRTADSFP